LREVIYDVGGNPNNKQFKAIQIGGPMGACMPAEFLDLPLTTTLCKKAAE